MTAMAAKLKFQETERKLKEADCAMDRVFKCLQGVGTIQGERITLLIEKVKGDDERNPSCL